MNLPASAKDTAKAITRWCENEGIAHTFTHLKGGHLAVIMKRLGKTRRVVFSASPSDRRSVENVLRDVRKEARVLGWTPKSQEDNMGICIGGTYGHKPQPQVSTGPAGPVTVTKPENRAPAPPPQYVGKKFAPATSNPKLRLQLSRRNDWVIGEDDKGRPHADILKELCEVGWYLTNVASVGSMIDRTKARREATPPPKEARLTAIRKDISAQTPPERVKWLEAKEREIAQEHKNKLPSEWRKRVGELAEKRGLIELSECEKKSDASALAIAIEQAIIPVMEAHFAKQHAELKAKADKWDAISGLVREA